MSLECAEDVDCLLIRNQLLWERAHNTMKRNPEAGNDGFVLRGK